MAGENSPNLEFSAPRNQINPAKYLCSHLKTQARQEKKKSLSGSVKLEVFVKIKVVADAISWEIQSSHLGAADTAVPELFLTLEESWRENLRVF